MYLKLSSYDICPTSIKLIHSFNSFERAFKSAVTNCTVCKIVAQCITFMYVNWLPDYINVSDGCWRWNVLVTTLRFRWQFWANTFRHFGHPLCFCISVGHQHSNDIFKIEIPWPTKIVTNFKSPLSRCHHHHCHRYNYVRVKRVQSFHDGASQKLYKNGNSIMQLSFDGKFSTW